LFSFVFDHFTITQKMNADNALSAILELFGKSGRLPPMGMTVEQARKLSPEMVESIRAKRSHRGRRPGLGTVTANEVGRPLDEGWAHS
jgi:hypothetical protein